MLIQMTLDFFGIFRTRKISLNQAVGNQVQCFLNTRLRRSFCRKKFRSDTGGEDRTLSVNQLMKFLLDPQQHIACRF